MLAKDNGYGLKIILTTFLIILSMNIKVKAEEWPAGQAGAFLKLGMDARVLGSGGAGIALAQDVAAIYWNPAGLARVKQPELMLAYTQFPESGDYSQLAYVLPLREFSLLTDKYDQSFAQTSLGAIGWYVMRWAASYTIEAREIDALNPDYLFSDIEGCYGLGFGTEILPALQCGMAVKGLYHQLDQADAKGWGLDIGANWTGITPFCLAFVVRNLFTQLYWSTGYQEVFPMVLKAGASYEWTGWIGQEIIFCADIESTLTSTLTHLHYYLGGEYALAKMLFIRIGCRQGFLTMGGGIYWLNVGWGKTSLQIDYAAVQDQILDWDHWITLKILF